MSQKNDKRAERIIVNEILNELSDFRSGVSSICTKYADFCWCNRRAAESGTRPSKEEFDRYWGEYKNARNELMPLSQFNIGKRCYALQDARPDILKDPENPQTVDLSYLPLKLLGLYGAFEHMLNSRKEDPRQPYRQDILDKFCRVYSDTRAYIDSLDENGSDEPLPTSLNAREETIHLYIDTQTNSLTEFSQRLQSIDHLYKDIACFLPRGNSPSEPLKIHNVQSGSIVATLVGNEKIIGIITSLIKSAAGLLHSRYTKEGKIESIPQQVEAIEKVLNLSEQLSQSGIDTSTMNESIASASLHIAEHLNSIIGGNKAIFLNNQRIPVMERGEVKPEYKSTLRRMIDKQAEERAQFYRDEGESSTQ